jgi:tetratricopeptide (TPR) repeat protein
MWSVELDLLFEQGRELFDNERFEEAVLTYEAALELAQKLKDQKREAHAYQNLASSYYCLENFGCLYVQIHFFNSLKLKNEIISKFICFVHIFDTFRMKMNKWEWMRMNEREWVRMSEWEWVRMSEWEWVRMSEWE